MSQASLDAPVTDSLKSLAVDIVDIKHVYPPRRPSRKAKQQQVSTEPITALKSLSLQVNESEIFGILGPNGSGKSTLFQIISTLLKPTSGTARITGFDILSQPQLVRQQLGVVFQSPSLDDKLTAMENLLHHGHLYGLAGSDLKQRANDALAAVSLTERANDFIETFSGGMKRRVEIAKAMLHQPRLLLLDEPSTGLDPSARREIWQHLSKLRDDLGITILMTTHLMDEAEKCDRLAIVHLGELVAVDTPDSLKQQIGGDVIQIDCQSATELMPELAAMYPENTLSEIDGRLLLECEDGPVQVAKIASAFGQKIKRIAVGQPTLEDVFMHLTGDKLADG
ncbi:MAG TPA: ABC transporter ATP-binding protein [Phycisphaerales bacterium]|nr:ABC transporter ATP-binding protein [Phycisphaerales bacterium]HCD34220.1 ABC transporter ATP-binding protein [Phycisphaerales bacterium]|tara:strand:- start:2833 stop:3849 length:1017 start_codon:yes stop_codon:yes gene_type:complete